LQTIRISSLRSFSLCKVVHNLLVTVGLLDVAVVKVHDGVAIRECLSPHSIAENHLFLSILVSSLYLAIIPNDLFLHNRVLRFSIVVMIWELHFVILFFVIHSCHVLLFFDVRFLVLLIYFRNVIDRLVVGRVHLSILHFIFFVLDHFFFYAWSLIF